MRLQGAPTFSPADYPDVSEQLLQRLTQSFDELYSAGASQPERGSASGSFISAASGVTTVDVKNPLSSKLKHITLALRRDDLADFSAAWSWWYRISGEHVRLSFIGLPASARCVYSVELF